MSILKAKIARLQEKNASKLAQEKTIPRKEKLEDSLFNSRTNSESLTPTPTSSPKVSHSRSQTSPKTQENSFSNNIMKNYCRGIINFTLSSTAVIYLSPMLEKHNISLEAYRKFIRLRKNKINCIKQLREILLTAHQDTAEIIAMKDVFKEITVIFLKYFSPNWIYNSKIADKYAHLKFRFKILRRVRNPHYFTYLQGFSS